MLLLVPGVILVGLAGGFAFASYQIRRIRRFVAAATGTRLVDSLGELRAESGTVQVTGRTRPGPTGLLTTPYGTVACVWHRHVVTRPVADAEPGNEAATVEEDESTAPFVVEDATGRALVDPRGSRPFDAAPVVDRWDPDSRLRQQEWALLADTSVSVRGEVTRSDGELMIRRPSDGSVFAIAAESRAGLPRRLDQAYRHRRPLCVAAALIGAALIAAGLLLG